MGALDLAKSFAKRLRAPLVYSTTSRLLVDLNRSVGHKSLHFEPIQALPVSTREKIIEKFWRPYRSRIESIVGRWAQNRNKIFHISSHSFTPKLNGHIRQADVAFLYDPARMGEVRLAKAWSSELKRLRPDLRIRRNYPYQGKSDGVMKSFRQKWNASTYIGIELEVNQAMLISKNKFSGKLGEDLISSFLNATV